MEIIQIVDALKQVEGNPWVLAFLFLYGIGWLLKEHTKLNNMVIPWVLMAVGAILGFLVIQATVSGALIGAVMSFVIMWFYDRIRELVNLYFTKKKA